MFVLKFIINSLLAKNVNANKGFLTETGNCVAGGGGRREEPISLMRNQGKVNRASNTFIYIYIIYIYSWISALFFFGSPSLSLFRSV